MSDPTEDLRVNADLTIPAAELAWRFSRSPGPGGQSVNTTDSRVELRWDPGTSHALTDAQRAQLRSVFVVTASEQRSQLRNRMAARERLARRIAAALTKRPKLRKRTRPSAGATTRRLDVKRRRSQLKATRRRPTTGD